MCAHGAVSAWAKRHSTKAAEPRRRRDRRTRTSESERGESVEHAVWSVVCFRDVKAGLRWQMGAWLTCCTCYITIFHDTKHDSSYFRNLMLSQKAVWSLCLFDGVLSSWRAMIVFVLREFRMSPFPFLPRRHTTIRLRTADKTNEPWSEMKRSR